MDHLESHFLSPTLTCPPVAMRSERARGPKLFALPQQQCKQCWVLLKEGDSTALFFLRDSLFLGMLNSGRPFCLFFPFNPTSNWNSLSWNCPWEWARCFWGAGSLSSCSEGSWHWQCYFRAKGFNARLEHQCILAAYFQSAVSHWNCRTAGTKELLRCFVVFFQGVSFQNAYWYMYVIYSIETLYCI